MIFFIIFILCMLVFIVFDFFHLKKYKKKNRSVLIGFYVITILLYILFVIDINVNMPTQYIIKYAAPWLRDLFEGVQT